MSREHHEPASAASPAIVQEERSKANSRLQFIALTVQLVTHTLQREEVVRSTGQEQVCRIVLSERAEYFHQIILDQQDSLPQYLKVGELLQLWHSYITGVREYVEASIWYGVALAMWLRQQREIHNILASSLSASALSKSSL